jgi:hypothetical protein
MVQALALLQQRAHAAAPPPGGGPPGLLRLEQFYGGAAGAADMGPLPPHVCSLALLPSGAAGYVPESVRWLMEEGSPVFDMYRECPVGGAPGAGGGAWLGARKVLAPLALEGLLKPPSNFNLKTNPAPSLFL